MNHGHSADLISEPEFIIYSFEKDETSKGSPVWQTYGRVKTEEEAFRKADALFMSAKFTRIEVRKKEIDSVTGKISDEAVRVLGSAPSRETDMLLFLGAAFGCAVVAGLLTFLN